MSIAEIPNYILNDGDTSPTESTLIHSYPGSMPAYLASRLCERYSSEGDTVLDPFCGSGVVLIESAKLRRKVIGFDLLEAATEIAKAAFSLSEPEHILSLWHQIHEKALESISLFKAPKIKEEQLSECHQELSAWFHKETFIEILALYREIRFIENVSERKFFFFILSSSLISLSHRISRGVLHWGWIADNVKPKNMDLLKTNAFEEVDKRIHRLIDFMRATNSYNLLSNADSYITTFNWLDNIDLPDIKKESLDLLLTSPPYPYSIDYTLALRLTHYLLEKPFDLIRNNEIGARHKRKRNNKESQYLQELVKALKKASSYIKVEGKAVFVLPHPDEYRNIINLSLDEWLELIKNSMSGSWKVIELGYRDCSQRRVVHKTKSIRRELIVAFVRAN